MKIKKKPQHTLLALHGFTGAGADFEILAAALQQTIHTLDLPGHHTPSLPYHQTIARLAAWCQTVPNPVLIGYSLGGRLALATAQQTMLAGLVLIGASPGLATEAERTARRESDDMLARKILKEGCSTFLEHWQQQPLIASQANIPSPWREEQLRRKQNLSAAGLAATLRELGTGTQPSLWETLPNINTQCLLITGEHDTKFTAIAAQMALQMPRAKHCLVQGVGHAAHLEAAEKTAALLLPWLADLHYSQDYSILR